MSRFSPERQRLEDLHATGEEVLGESISRATLDGIDLKGANWREVELRRTNMNNALLEGARLVDCEIANTGLRATNLVRTWLDTVRLTLCDLAQADLAFSTLRDVVFEETPMPFSSMEGALLSRTSFRVVDLQNANMRQAALLHCRFRDERLGGINLMGANLRDAILLDCDLAQANLQGADLRGAILLGVNLTGANLDQIQAEGAVGFDVTGASPALGVVRDSREAHLALHRRVQSMGGAARLAVELAFTSLVDGTQAIQGSRDPMAQILRQRNLTFSDLIRFLKERFDHDELNQFVVDGDQVGVRTDGGTVPLTRYGGSASMGQGRASRSSQANRPTGGGIGSFRRSGGGGSAASAAPAPAPASRDTPTSPAPRARQEEDGPGIRRRNIQEDQMPKDGGEIFEDSRFGLIDLDEDETF